VLPLVNTRLVDPSASMLVTVPSVPEPPHLLATARRGPGRGG